MVCVCSKRRLCKRQWLRARSASACFWISTSRLIPYLTLPCLALPYLTLPYLTLPYLTLPYLTLPYHTIPYLTLPYLPCLALPHLTSSYLTLPHPYPYLTFSSSQPPACRTLSHKLPCHRIACQVLCISQTVLCHNFRYKSAPARLSSLC